MSQIKTIDELVKDEALMNMFMNSKSAVQYMSTNDDILNAVSNSEVAMRALNENKDNIISPKLNGYVENLKYSSCNSDTWGAWKVFDRNEGTQWGTNNNETLPNWIEYDLSKEYLIYRVEVVNAYQSGMGEQSGNVYINDVNVGSYDVKKETEHYNVDCLTQGNKIKVTCDRYNWQSLQSYLSEIYVYGIKIQD